MRIVYFRFEGRNGYWAIDEYLGDTCRRHTVSLGTKKQALSVCSSLNNIAYQLNQAKALLEQAQAALPDMRFDTGCDDPKELIEQFLSNYK